MLNKINNKNLREKNTKRCDCALILQTSASTTLNVEPENTLNVDHSFKDDVQAKQFGLHANM